MQTMGKGEARSDTKPLSNDSFKWSFRDCSHWDLLLSIPATIFIGIKIMLNKENKHLKGLRNDNVFVVI